MSKTASPLSLSPPTTHPVGHTPFNFIIALPALWSSYCPLLLPVSVHGHFCLPSVECRLGVNLSCPHLYPHCQNSAWHLLSIYWINEERMHGKQQMKRREKMRGFQVEYLILMKNFFIFLYTMQVFGIYYLPLGIGDTKWGRHRTCFPNCSLTGLLWELGKVEWWALGGGLATPPTSKKTCEPYRWMGVAWWREGADIAFTAKRKAGDKSFRLGSSADILVFVHWLRSPYCNSLAPSLL